MISSDQLIPGDVVSLSRSSDDSHLVPCDMVLLRGPCIVDESLLTGESVPQMKEPLESMPQDQIHQFLNMENESKLHILSGGTRIVQHTSYVSLLTFFYSHIEIYSFWKFEIFILFVTLRSKNYCLIYSPFFFFCKDLPR